MHAIIAALLVLVFPIWDLYEAKRARQSGERTRWYVSAMAWPWIVTLILLFTAPNIFVPPLSYRPPLEVFIGIVVGVLVVLALPLVSHRRQPQMPSIDFMLPRSATERVLFALVALSAGVTEEIIYRGFLIRYLQQWMWIGVAIAFAAAIFAVDHIYQGLAGTLVAFAMALVLTGLFVIAGSLWLPIVVHAAIDLRLLAVSAAPRS